MISEIETKSVSLCSSDHKNRRRRYATAGTMTTSASNHATVMEIRTATSSSWSTSALPVRSPQDVRLRNGLLVPVFKNNQSNGLNGLMNNSGTKAANNSDQTPSRQHGPPSIQLFRRSSPQHGSNNVDEKVKQSSVGRNKSHLYTIIGLVLIIVGSFVFTFIIHKVYFTAWFRTPQWSSLVPKRQPTHPSQLIRTSELLLSTSSAAALSAKTLDLSFKKETSQDSTKRFVSHPRVIYMETPLWTFEEWSIQRKSRSELDVELNHAFENDNEWQPHQNINGSDCIPKAEWQTKSNPNCNSIHEIDFAISAAREVIDSSSIKISYFASDDNLSLLGEGWFRTTWRLDRNVPSVATKSSKSKHKSVNIPPVHESVVLKTLRIEREFLSEYYELHRRDAVAMERLTGSNFVVNVFGFCAQSAINELADFSYPGVQNLESFNRRLRGINNQKSAIIKLRMAASIALGIADIHAAGEHHNEHNSHHHPIHNDNGNVYMVHYDLNPRNIALFAGGRPKLNDFNIAEFLRYDTHTNKTCGFPSRLHEPWWRAPEEMNINATHEGIMIDEKVDIYALGNILYHTLTSHAPWGKMKKERIPEVRPKVAVGIHPQISKLYTHDKDPHIKALVKAINMCWVLDPVKRATAEEVAAVLYGPLINEKELPSLSHSKAIPDMETHQQDNKLKGELSNNNGDDDDNGDEVEDKNAFGHGKR
jgi:Protein kinase domain